MNKLIQSLLHYGIRQCTEISYLFDVSDGFFGQDNLGGGRFDLLLDSATEAVHWVHDQMASEESGM